MFPKNFLYKILPVVTAGLAITAVIAFAWTEPSSTPPGGNASAPVNVGNIGQSKSGGIILNTGGATNGLIVQYGNVGIGITSPGYKLDVVGPSGGNQVLNVRNPSGSWGQYALVRAQSDVLDTNFVDFGYYRGDQGLESTRGFIINSQSNNRLLTILDQSGYVGIGATPTASLDVSGQIRIRGGSPGANKVLTSDATGLATWQTPAGSGVGGSGTTNYVAKFTSGSALGNSQILDDGTNVGIGTIAPFSKLQIAGNYNALFPSTDGSAQLVITGSTDSTLRLQLGYDTTDNYGFIRATHGRVAVGPLILQPDAGNVGIGTINPGATLDVNGNIRSYSGGSYGSGGIGFGYHTLNSNSDGWLYLGDESGAAYGGNRGLAANKLLANSVLYAPTIYMNTAGISYVSGSPASLRITGAYNGPLSGNDAWLSGSNFTEFINKVRISSDFQVNGAVAINDQLYFGGGFTGGFTNDRLIEATDASSPWGESLHIVGKKPGGTGSPKIVLDGNAYFTGDPTFAGGELFFNYAFPRIRTGPAVSGVSYLIISDSNANAKFRLDTFSGIGRAKDSWVSDNGIDLAEKIDITNPESVGPGSIVVADINSKERVVISSKAYDEGVIGVISTSPGFILGGGDETKLDISNAVALAGRVPVNVTNENGPIKIGDPIVTSSIPGYGMKGDREKVNALNLIGKAMENFGEKEGKITVMIK